ncbi:hypothetical protein EU519_00480 [Candidatus Thorarchaeota archaeon]|nr:MAG: hypothetical protein EU519_00480 [Candidatus Thorarchaeota archaeon]
MENQELSWHYSLYPVIVSHMSVHCMNDKDDLSVKKMADLLRRGATMLAQPCPHCGSPLMKAGDEVFCTTCNSRIGEEQREQISLEKKIDSSVFAALRMNIIQKLNALNEVLEREVDVDTLTRLANLLLLLLQSLEKLEKY